MAKIDKCSVSVSRTINMWIVVCVFSLTVAVRVLNVSTESVDSSTVDVFTDGQRVVKLFLGESLVSTGGDVIPASDTSIRCATYSNRSVESGMFDVSVKVVSVEDLDMLLDICHTIPGQHTHRHKRFIIPGTKWCGLGNVASDYEDLGREAETDRCCRTHDHCPDHISPFQTKYGITNWSILYRFNCDCEDRFYGCLKNATEERAASLVGRLYFNLLQPKCFKVGHPKKCQRKGWWFTCKERGIDTTKAQDWRFYKVGKYF